MGSWPLKDSRSKIFYYKFYTQQLVSFFLRNEKKNNDNIIYK